MILCRRRLGSARLIWRAERLEVESQCVEVGRSAERKLGPVVLVVLHGKPPIKLTEELTSHQSHLWCSLCERKTRLRSWVLGVPVGDFRDLVGAFYAVPGAEL